MNIDIYGERPDGPPKKGPIPPCNVLGRRDTVAAVLSPGRVARISQGNL
jgi:hypothetical protein